jgi:glycosyltransferase involved in cell wall biosynthesis
VTAQLPLAGLVAPVTVAEIELADPVTVTYVSVAEPPCDRIPQALVLVRLHATPIGTIVVDAPDGRVDTKSCAEDGWALVDGLRDPLGPEGVSPVPLPGAGTAGPDGTHERQDAQAPFISVVVATRERPRSLMACLDSLARLDYPNYEVVVVDNDPVTDETAALMPSRRETNLRYTREPRRGLAAAHNCGLEHTTGSIIAFTDDDVIVDRNWLTEVARAFQAGPDVACVTGLIMPAELQTPAQLLLETHGHFSKGFVQRLVDCHGHRPQDQLFPFAVGRLGSGANMAFSREFLRELRGFDPATGVGTATRGGDDLGAFFSVLAAGHSLVYQPRALVWHHHRREVASLSRQVYGYGVGLGAYLTSVVVRHPALLGQALRRAPNALIYAFPGSPRNPRADGSWPRRLVMKEWQGIAFGPIAYCVSRWRNRRAHRPNCGPAAPQ